MSVYYLCFWLAWLIPWIIATPIILSLGGLNIMKRFSCRRVKGRHRVRKILLFPFMPIQVIVMLVLHLVYHFVVHPMQKRLRESEEGRSFRGMEKLPEQELGLLEERCSELQVELAVLLGRRNQLLADLNEKADARCATASEQLSATHVEELPQP